MAALVEPVLLEIARTCTFKKKKPDEGTGARRIGCERCGKARLHRDHLGTPPSLNALVSSNVHALRAQKDAWQRALPSELRASDLGPTDRVMAEGECCFGTQQRRDGGNHRVLLEKALGDALTEGGYLVDDDWNRYEFGRRTPTYKTGEAWTRAMLFPG